MIVFQLSCQRADFLGSRAVEHFEEKGLKTGETRRAFSVQTKKSEIEHNLVVTKRMQSWGSRRGCPLCWGQCLLQGKGCCRDQGLSVYSALTIPTGAQEDFASLPLGMDAAPAPKPQKIYHRQREELGQPTTTHVIQSQEYATDCDPRLG